MKLLLTSNGLSNESIAKALEELVGLPRQQIKIAFIPNAAFVIDDFKLEGREWFIEDLYRIKKIAGFVDIVSLTDVNADELMKRLEHANVIFVGGGNTFYLSYLMDKTGLFAELPRLLQTRVYVGLSAGSMIATQSIRTASQAIKNPEKFYDEMYDELGPVGRSSGKTARLVNFEVRPHYKSKTFPKVRGDFLEAIAKDVKLPVYAIDDQSAVKVDGDKIEVISEGEWRLVKEI